MKRCNCGCELFGGFENKSYYVHFDGDKERADETCEFVEVVENGGPFTCLECDHAYFDWDDIPEEE
ncbi:MAG: hypothetical protein V1897_02280 [Pseudomonadota bacterium]